MAGDPVPYTVAGDSFITSLLLVCFLKYYFDLKSETFAKLLLAEKCVFFVPGSCFDKEYYFRLGLAQDSKLFKAGLNELSNFVDEHLIS